MVNKNSKESEPKIDWQVLEKVTKKVLDHKPAKKVTQTKAEPVGFEPTKGALTPSLDS